MTEFYARLRFDEVVDRCIQDITDGDATVEQCLARWPEYADELAPLLEPMADLAILASTVRTPQPDPARRAAFMAEIRTTPQQQPRRLRMPALPSIGSLFGPGGLNLGGAAMRFATVAGAAAAIALFAVLAVVSQPPSSASAATLTVFAGQVEVQTDGTWRLLADGAALDTGTAIRTSADGRALITFRDGSTATLDAATEVALGRVRLSGVREIEIQQASGRLWSDVVTARSDSASYVVRTPHAVIEARGTVFETVVDGETTVATTTGLVQLVRGTARVDVAAGQSVRATLDSVDEPQAIEFVGQVHVRAPVAAALSSPDGASTGLLPSGMLFRQIPGVTTTTLDGDVQRLGVADIRPGVYSLWLRRFEEGAGVVVIETAEGHVTVPVPEDVESARVQLAIDIVDGGVLMRVLDTQVERATPPQVRVVESPRSRQAVSLQALLARNPLTATVTATAEPTQNVARPSATATEAPRRNDDSGRGNDNGDRGQGRIATPTLTPTSAAELIFRAQLESALRSAAQSSDARPLAALLGSLLDGDDREDRERLAALGEVLDDAAVRDLVLAALAAGGSDAVEELLERLNEDDLQRSDLSDLLNQRLEGLFGDRGNDDQDDRDDRRGNDRNNGRGNNDRDDEDDRRRGNRGRGNDRSDASLELPRIPLLRGVLEDDRRGLLPAFERRTAQSAAEDSQPLLEESDEPAFAEDDDRPERSRFPSLFR